MIRQIEDEMIGKVRAKLARNGRNPKNNNAGIPVGSDLHHCEVLLKRLDFLNDALQTISNYSPASTVQPVLIARSALKGEKW